VRVTNYKGTRETEAFVEGGHVTLLGGGALPIREFYKLYIVQPERRQVGDRRVTLERRRVPMQARRIKGRRRWDCMTRREREALTCGIHWTVPEHALPDDAA
jgi:hypothetical protein